MFFDELERIALVERYRALPEHEREAYRALSVVFAPVATATLTTILNACGIESPDGFKRKWQREKDVLPMLARWEKSELVRQYAQRSGMRWACNILTVEVATREAIGRGEHDRFGRAAEDALSIRPAGQAYYYDSPPLYLRATREAIYRGDVDALRLLANAEVRDDRYDYDGVFATDPFRDIIANPLDFDLLRALPVEIAYTAFQRLLSMARDAPPLFRALVDELDDWHRKRPRDDSLTFLWAEYALLQGRVDEVMEAVGSTSDPEEASIVAACLLLRGDREGALATYEEGLKLLKKATGRRKIAFESWTGIFYPILLFATSAPGKKILDYLKSYAGWGVIDMSPALETVRMLVDPEAHDEGLFTQETEYAGSARACLSAFFLLLCAYWRDAEKARKYLSLADATHRRLSDLGANLLAPELAALIRELAPQSAKRFEDIPPPAHPLKDLIVRQTNWQRSLTALSEIGGAEGAKASARDKRFTWELAWGTRDGIARYISITPMEQSLLRSGWSKGKRVALKRIYRTASAIASMTERDHRVAAAIRESRNYYGAEYDIETGPALQALAGHPFVFREEDGAHVEIVSSEPQLLVTAEGGRYTLKLSPFPHNLVADCVVREDGPAALRIVSFEERHVRIARILGENGLSVPQDAHASLLQTLGSLSSVVTVHSDIEGVESGAAFVDADGRVCVQLAPAGEGLDVEMVVRPLGSGSVPCRPGMGGGQIFGLVEGRRVQTRRDRQAERDALMLALGSCPALAEAEETGPEKWHIREPETALEFLTQLQELKDVVVEWPRGGTMQVRGQVGISSMKVSLRGMQEWFGLSGELRIDDGLVIGMKELIELLKIGHGRFLPIGEGQFVALAEEFRRRLDALASLGDRKGDELRIPALAAGLLSPLLSEAGSISADAAWERRKNLIDEAAALTPALPSTLRGELRGYQTEGYQWLARLAHWGAGACLADDMGLGKTVQALALLLSRGPGGPALVVAPTSVCANWIAEAARFAPTLNVRELRYGDRAETLAGLGPLDVVVATYGLMQGEIERLEAIEWHTIILDEAQAIKNMGTRRSAAAMKLRGDFRMVTTGTPIENRLSELWNLFRFLNPHLLGSHESFAERFALPIERDGNREARKRLRRLLSPFILRRSKEQVLEELPPKTEITLRVEMHGDEAAFYEALRSRAVEAFEEGNPEERRFQIFAELMRLRRACCNTSLVAPEKTFSSAKLEAFDEILNELRENHHKALVFSQFVDHLKIVKKHLDEAGVPCQYLDGSTPPQERARRVAAFQAGEGDCFLISLKAGGTGLNLTAADYVIHMDPWWNPAVEAQASDRAHRIGQERPVTIYRIVAKGTIEEKIVDLHAWKRDLAETLLEETDAPSRLSAEEMLALLREA